MVLSNVAEDETRSEGKRVIGQVDEPSQAEADYYSRRSSVLPLSPLILLVDILPVSAVLVERIAIMGREISAKITRNRKMQSHEDNSHFMSEAELSKLAGEMKKNKVQDEWEYDGIHVRKLPDDELDILRISIGGGDNIPVNVNYLVFRGDRVECIKLLRKALSALDYGER